MSIAELTPISEASIAAGVEAGWREFERITNSPLPAWKGGYTPSRGAFEFSFRVGVRALTEMDQP